MAPIIPCRSDSPRADEPPPAPPLMVPLSGNLTLVPAHRVRVALASSGARISVELPGDASHRWTEVQSTNEAVLVPIDVSLDVRGGCSGSFRADEVGEAQLVATDRARAPEPTARPALVRDGKGEPVLSPVGVARPLPSPDPGHKTTSHPVRDEGHRHARRDHGDQATTGSAVEETPDDVQATLT